LKDKFILYNLASPTHRATPQIPLEEEGVKKSSTAERPVESKRSALIIDSIESILNFKTRPNDLETGVADEARFAVSRELQDRNKLKSLYGKGPPVSKKLDIPTYKNKMEVFRRVQTPLIPLPHISSNSATGDLLAAKAPVFRRGETSRFPIPRPRSKDTDSDSLVAETEVFHRGQTSRNPIPHPLLEVNGGESSGSKRNLAFSDGTSKILERKTLLYSEPLYRPTGGLVVRKEPLDPRRLISILGDPLPFSKSNIAANKDTSHVSKRVHINDGPRRNMFRKVHARGAYLRKAHFKHHRKEKIHLREKNRDQDGQEFTETMVRLLSICFRTNYLGHQRFFSKFTLGLAHSRNAPGTQGSLRKKSLLSRSLRKRSIVSFLREGNMSCV